jgi:hypothetical protein
MTDGRWDRRLDGSSQIQREGRMEGQRRKANVICYLLCPIFHLASYGAVYITPHSPPSPFDQQIKKKDIYG